MKHYLIIPQTGIKGLMKFKGLGKFFKQNKIEIQFRIPAYEIRRNIIRKKSNFIIFPHQKSISDIFLSKTNFM
jgi:virulence-associated protein VagC